MITHLFNLRTVAGLLILPFVAVALFAGVFEATVVNGAADNDDVNVTMSVTEQISIDSPADATMTALNITNDQSTGSATWTVVTNATAGYTLAVHGSEANAMQNQTTPGEDFTDYTVAVANTPEEWSVTNAYEFGFSAHGNHVPDGTWGAGSSCGSGTVPGDLNYRGFNATTNIQVASSSTETSQAGTASTVCFAAEQDTVLAPAGEYTAVVVATATTQ